MRISDWSSDVCSSDLFGTGGIIVNYGTSPEGMGDNYMSVDEPSMDPNANNALPDRVVPNETPQPVASQQASDKAIVTQDMEDAPAVVTKTNKPSTTPTVTPEKPVRKPKNEKASCREMVCQDEKSTGVDEQLKKKNKKK